MRRRAQGRIGRGGVAVGLRVADVVRDVPVDPCGTPGKAATKASVRAGRSSYSTRISSAPSRACASSFGDDQGDRLADEAHAVPREQRPGRHAQRRDDAFGRRLHPEAPRRLELAAHEDGGHAGHRARRVRIDANDPGMRAVGAQENGAGRARDMPICGKRSLPGKQAIILATKRVGHRASITTGISPETVLRALLLRAHGGFENVAVAEDHPKPAPTEGRVA